MENMLMKMLPMRALNVPLTASLRQFVPKKFYSTDIRNMMKKPKHRHPFRKIHPWRSVLEFSKSITAGVIHNEDGLVAINKPYGISGKNQKIKESGMRKAIPTGIVKEVNYSLSDAIPHIAEELGYPSLKLISTPERFTSGVAILAANDKVENAVNLSLRRAQGLRIIPKTYWAVTTRVPNEIKGEKRLAMTMKRSPSGKSQLPIILTSWAQNEQKRGDIKILNVQFEIISNSTDNLSSLIAIKSSTKAWHALRLFASTVLYSPILGDNIYGSRVQNVMGKWMNISPFVDAAQVPPKLNKDLLEILKISPGKESMIPAHIHLREIYLPMYRFKDRNLVLTAPPMPEFIWTGQQLKFKHELFKIEGEEEDELTDHHQDPVRYQAVT